jgi:hypothetical protein
MKVTAIIPNELVNEVRATAGGRNLTESLIVALREWLALRKIRQLNEAVAENPVKFIAEYDADSIRALNRRR